MKKMRNNLQTWQAVLEQDFPDTEITRTGVEASRKSEIGRLPASIRMGFYRTPAEFERYITLGTQLTLPGSANYNPQKNEKLLAEMRSL